MVQMKTHKDSSCNLFCGFQKNGIKKCHTIYHDLLTRVPYNISQPQLPCMPYKKVKLSDILTDLDTQS